MSGDERDTLRELRRGLGDRLKTWRRQAGLSQEHLASRLGYSRTAVGAAETGSQQRPKEFWARCDDLLGAGGAIIAAHRDLTAFQREQARERVRRAEADREARIQRWRQDAGLAPLSAGAQAVPVAPPGA